MCQLRALLNQDVVEKALADLDQNRRVTWLSRTLRRLLAYTYWSKYFFPPRAETVRREALAICSERGLTKIFAILLLMGKPELIKDFLKEGLCDDDLPFEKVDPDIETTRIKFWLRPKRNGNKDQRPVPAFIRRWPASYLGPFADFQWSVLAPFLQTDEQQWREPFPDDTILPFTSEQRLHGGTKNRPEILKVEIHPEHHDFDKTNNIFVIKKISIDHEKVFLQELRVLNRLKHDHVIGLFAAYQHRQHYLMVLPCAKCNLAEYWEKENTRPVQNHATLAWIAIQSRGVVDGLAQLHRHLTGSTSSLHEQESGASTVLPSNRAPVREYYGRHGDIKPENLLWFPGSPGNPGDMGIIKIADFGESRYSSTESALQDTRKLKYTLPYRPPEFRLDRSNQPKPISATSDTWALGCVFLEFISWYDGGWQRLEQFVSLRKQQTGKGRRYREPTSGYFRLSKVEPMDNNMEPSQYAELKPSVTSQFDILRRNLAVESNRFSELIRRFLALIQEHMLVIEPYRTSESGQFYRYTSKEVFEELDKIIRDHLDEVQAASD
ncbi:kinase-like domain-containing protein [Cladorrhinum samala]|uniref:Kinase-like domain-containing protein n=1 Tax=Cladorrhinum samala TaxID=585594 RepID=A0AAV9HD34_9PEZI|nr:kinase-like domain-containing protein [Cladorrhinum samala]